jgi:hypothetical protein
MGGVLAFFGFFSVAVLITVHGVLILFSAERFRQLILFLSPGTKKHPWVLANLHGVEYKIAGVVFVFMGLALLYALLSRG